MGGMTWPEPGSGISANLAESLISIKVKNVARPGLLAVGSICPNTKEEEKEQQEEDQRAKPQSPPNPPTRIHCTNGNYAYLTEAVLWGQSKLKTLFHRYGDQADARARREDVTICGSDAECEGPWRSCMYF